MRSTSRLTYFDIPLKIHLFSGGFSYKSVIGEGTRVALQTTNGVGPATSTTAYIGDVEEVQTAGSTTTTTTYYYAGSDRVAEAVNGTFSYLGSDRLGSPVVNLPTSGITTATQLYAPYGASRYSSGTMPTDIGYTGQHADSATGLDYYVSRYYDPSLGQFISFQYAFVKQPTS